MKKNKIILLSFLTIFLIVGCTSNEQGKNTKTKHLPNNKNLNLTILIDLSDRISIKKNPNQVDDDLKFISGVLKIFKKYMAEKGVVHSEDKIKVVYYPELKNDLMNSIFDSLTVDFSSLSFIERKKVFSNLEDRFTTNLKNIYQIASNKSEYYGSDLFNYFQHRVVDDCIINDSNYINILLILTDGYIYHQNSTYQKGNRFSYLVPKAKHIQIFRNRADWEKFFDAKDYGLMDTGLDLSNLVIIAAQFNPVYYSPKDFDIMKKYWSKWFEEQKVKPENYKILRNDNPGLNIRVLESFLTNITRR